MSSPPPPPNPFTTPSISNPKMRRPQGAGASSAPSTPPSSSSPQQQQQQTQQLHPAKKARMHPLRQTSFPASEDSDPRVFTATNTAKSDIDTGSVTGSFTGSLDGVNLTGGKKKGKGRTGRPRKNKEGTPGAPGSAKGSVVDGEKGGGGGGGGGSGGSMVDGDAGSSVRGGAGDGGSRVGGEEEEEEEEDDVEGELFEGEQGPTDTEAEKKNLAILIDAFDSEQSARYNLFKRTKLRKEALRRMVNQVLSQSVPPSVVTTVNGYTKLFIGEIVERARVVQEQWADAYDQLAVEIAEAEAAEPSTAAVAAGSGNSSTETSAVEKQPSQNMNQATTPNESLLSGILTAAQLPPSQPTPSSTVTGVVHDGVSYPAPQTHKPNPATPTVPEKKPFTLPPNPHRGQLLPSHIREAYRRYKVDGEGGGVGYSGMSLKGLGVKGSVSCSIGGVGGRRLFR